MMNRCLNSAILRLTLSATALFVAFALAGVKRAGAAPSGFTLEQVMSSPFPDELVAARTGERVAWMFDMRGVRNLWIAEGPEFVARQVTHYSVDDGREIDSLRITPDGKTLVYSRGSETNSTGEVADPTSDVQKPEQEVWAVDVANGQPRLLGDMNCGEEGCEDIEISPDGQYAVWPARDALWFAPISGSVPAHQLCYVRGTNVDPQWSPDGREIAFTSERGDHSFIAIYNFGEQSLRYLQPSVDRDSLARWSSDGTKIAYLKVAGAERGLPIIPVRSVPWSIWVADAATGQAHSIWRSGDQMDDSIPRLTEDVSFHFAAGNRVVFASEMDGRNHLYSISTDGGSPTLLARGDFDVKDVTLSWDGKTVLYSSNENDVDRRHIWRVSVAGGKQEALTTGDTIEWTPVQTGDGAFTLCLGSSATTPAMPYRITDTGRAMIAREELPGDFPSNDLVTPKQVIFRSADGLEIHGQLFVPRGRTGKGPALVYMHGGSMRQMMLGFHLMQYYHNAYAENQYLVSKGFVVLSVNYRTGIMYGRAFREPADGGWRGASEYQDIVAAGKYLQAMSIVDPEKIGLWGGSYGGFLTAMGLARNSDIFKAGVDMHGVHDWSVFLMGGERRRFQAQGAPDMGDAIKLAFNSSPDASIATWKSPVLLIQGDDDRNVPFSQTVDLAQRLRAQHVPFEQIVFPDEIHDFLMWKTWVRAYAATADFFERVLVKGETISAPQ
ncbi:MAG TPA: prolyl oligopeptidase family serine peptidase [Candidatus Acidoferrales bacterium]|nr:prolyl oligopeptidase family serine peptidase [Candidatus Acidoferrales bacterium]